MIGRAAITPNPALDMDHVGLPESKAWTIYRPFILRRLAKQYNTASHRVPMTELAKWIGSKDPRAKRAMMEEIEARPPVSFSVHPNNDALWNLVRRVMGSSRLLMSRLGGRR